MTDLVKLLRDEDSYYRLQEKHWCIDAEELERQRLAAADCIEALEAENERLREANRALRRGLYGLMDSDDADTIATTLEAGGVVDWDKYPPSARAALEARHD